MNTQALFAQLVLGLINGSFYAMLSLGLAVIFGMLNIANFTHGAQYMLGALSAAIMLTAFGVDYWIALVAAPLLVGLSGVVIERLLLRRVYAINHMYGVLLTFGLSMIIQGICTYYYGSTGTPYPVPALLSGGVNLGFMYLPVYRAWVVVASLIICLATWYAIERTSLGARLRAATENAALVEAFGVNVPRLMTLTYAAGVALAGLAGVMAVPIYQAAPHMGHDIIIVVFAVVVIGGMGSIAGAIVSGFALGIIEGLTKYLYPQASSTVIFFVMALLLLFRPGGLFGSESGGGPKLGVASAEYRGNLPLWLVPVLMIIAGVIAPQFVYPLFIMKALCFAIFACAFNLLAGYAGLVSFGHAAFFGAAAYFAAQAGKAWGFPPELMLLGGAATGAALGLVFGWLAIRRQGIAFAMITLALAQIVYFYFLQAPFAGGEDGIQNVPAGRLFGLLDLSDMMTAYYAVLAIFLICFGFVWRIVHSPFGQALRAIRDNDARATSLGYDIARYKLLAFVLSATLSGIAGACTVIVFKIATLTNVHFMMSGEVLLMTLVGGIGTMLGPVVGAFLMAAMESFLAPFGAWVIVIQGIVFVLCVLCFRDGIVGGAIALADRLGDRRNLRARRKPDPAAHRVGLPASAAAE